MGNGGGGRCGLGWARGGAGLVGFGEHGEAGVAVDVFVGAARAAGGAGSGGGGGARGRAWAADAAEFEAQQGHDLQIEGEHDQLGQGG
jgi:hypothetical protein